MRQGGKFSIMAVCTSVKLEAYGDRRVTCAVLLQRLRVGQNYYGLADCRSSSAEADCCYTELYVFGSVWFRQTEQCLHVLKATRVQFKNRM